MQPTAIVTGSASGLGLEITKQLINLDYHVIGITKSKLNWKNTVQFKNENLQQFKFDITSHKKVSLFIKDIFKRFPRINVLINNAGYINNINKLENTSLKEFDKNLKINLYSTFYMCKYSIPLLLKNSPSTIVNISSYAGKRAVPLIAAYSASKFGVVALSQSIAKENKELGLKCYTICPGGMNTNMRNKVFSDASKQQSPELVAKVIIDTMAGKVKVDSGGDIVIRHGKIMVNPAPEN